MRPAEVVSPALLRAWPLPEPDEGGSKHDRGTVLVVGGAASTPGAVLLAGLGALRAGAGRLSVATVRSAQVALAIALPEALVDGLPEDEDGSLDPACAPQLTQSCGSAATVLLGPGLLGKQRVRALLEGVLPGVEEGTVVLDAVALTALGGAPELLAGLQGRVVLTPNGGELAALLDGDEREGDDAAAAVADRYGAVVVTQGAVAAPDGRFWRDGTGGIGLGTSGSGDVLAGVVAGLLAGGAEPAQAAVWGRHLHASAGDRLAARIGRTGYLARELLDEVPLVLGGLRT